MLRFFTAGESHGYGIVTFIEGLPAGLGISLDFVNSELSRRQRGYGRGGRMKIENDEALFVSGLYRGQTTGAPIIILVRNKDWENWKEVMDPFSYSKEATFTLPRPGHADLGGMIKFGFYDGRPILERASARETAGRVAGGAVFKLFLGHFGIRVYSYVTSVGPYKLDRDYDISCLDVVESSPVRCPDRNLAEKIMTYIDDIARKGDTVGGSFVVKAVGVPPGLGSHIQWDRRLDARIAQAIMSIQGIKAVALGSILSNELLGSKFHDEIFYDRDRGFYRITNKAGGVEGGISNGEEIVVHAYMKPIPTLVSPLRSVDVVTKEEGYAHKERSDVCAVVPASIVAEAMLAYVITDAILEKFGGDSLEETIRNYRAYIEYVRSY